METELSSPKGGSVNDGISRQLCSLSYLAVDDVAEVALQLGRGAKLAKLDIAKAFMEFLPIIMAAVVWGKYWKGLTIQCNCDNQSVVCIINSGTSKDPVLMQLLRCLFFVEAKFNCQVVADTPQVQKMGWQMHYHVTASQHSFLPTLRQTAIQHGYRTT